MRIQSAVIAWYRQNGRDLPWRRRGFSAWGTLVSEVMLQQTPVSRVLPKLDEWLRRWPSPADLAAASPAEAVRVWDRLGYPRRALALHACATAITSEHGGVVPRDVDALLRLPGVGDYTARAVAVFAYRDRHPVVDTNIRRVIARMVVGEAEPGPPSRRDLAVMAALLPEDSGAAHDFTAGMMELGALVCVARTPRCGSCPLAAACAWRLAGSPASSRPGRRTQPSYQGSDRQVRGIILAALREADHPVSRVALGALWPDRSQLERALGSLIADSLAVDTPAGITLPGNAA